MKKIKMRIKTEFWQLIGEEMKEKYAKVMIIMGAAIGVSAIKDFYLQQTGIVTIMNLVIVVWTSLAMISYKKHKKEVKEKEEEARK